ncbi:Yip1 family protein [Hymenobacter persicinus]|uniref:YIP1 family protein n=1 Tax=Hymenobacter persicinus TaxID=2025506 RepID=A0A4Q5LCH9_9BACT|nr:Yip1 family protein [Hymenobacter persicinus]RYU80719.1 YIP1 family protein [Hymenobacter persicinus]
MSDEPTVPINNPLTTIWFQPRRTLESILLYHPDKYVPVLLCLGGIARAVDRASQQNAGDKMGTVAVLLLTFVVGGLTGWIFYYFYAWMLSLTGRWLNGTAGSETFRTVLAWSLVPTVVSLALLLPEVLLFGDELFKSTPADISFSDSVIWIVISLIQLTLGIWSLVILVHGISLVQHFTAGRAILNLILPVAVILVPIVLLILLVQSF